MSKFGGSCLPDYAYGKIMTAKMVFVNLFGCGKAQIFPQTPRGYKCMGWLALAKQDAALSQGQPRDAPYISKSGK